MRQHHFIYSLEQHLTDCTWVLRMAIIPCTHTLMVEVASAEKLEKEGRSWLSAADVGRRIFHPQINRISAEYRCALCRKVLVWRERQCLTTSTTSNIQMSGTMESQFYSNSDNFSYDNYYTNSLPHGTPCNPCAKLCQIVFFLKKNVSLWQMVQISPQNRLYCVHHHLSQHANCIPSLASLLPKLTSVILSILVSRRIHIIAKKKITQSMMVLEIQDSYAIVHKRPAYTLLVQFLSHRAGLEKLHQGTGKWGFYEI